MSTDDVFSEWLASKMQIMNLDEEVYPNYIIGILDSEDSVTEKISSIRELISGSSACNITGVCEEICERYQASQRQVQAEEKVVEDASIDKKIAFIMEQQAQSIQKVMKATKSEEKLKAAILAQYAEISDDDDSPESYDESANVPQGFASNSIPQNTNVNAVVSAEKDLREKAKAEYEKKKAQDKLNKEKQKQKQQERRERERKRTQKGEHRR